MTRLRGGASIRWRTGPTGTLASAPTHTRVGWLQTIGPPGASGHGTQEGTLFGQGLRAGGVGWGARFAVDFVLFDVGQQLVEPAVGAFQFPDVIGRQPWRRPQQTRQRQSHLGCGGATGRQRDRGPWRGRRPVQRKLRRSPRPSHRPWPDPSALRPRQSAPLAAGTRRREVTLRAGAGRRHGGV
jgi:hypothetical protein